MCATAGLAKLLERSSRRQPILPQLGSEPLSKCALLPRVRFHDLRHAHATLMLLQSVHPKVVSERLGHSSIAITVDTYSDVLPGMQEEAAEAFDAVFPAVP